MPDKDEEGGEFEYDTDWMLANGEKTFRKKDLSRSPPSNIETIMRGVSHLQEEQFCFCFITFMTETPKTRIRLVVYIKNVQIS